MLVWYLSQTLSEAYLHSTWEESIVSENLVSFGARFFSVQFNTGLVLKHMFAILNMEDFTESTEAKMPRQTIFTKRPFLKA